MIRCYPPVKIPDNRAFLKIEVLRNWEIDINTVCGEPDKLALLVIILLLADVSPTYSSGLPQWNDVVF